MLSSRVQLVSQYAITLIHSFIATKEKKAILLFSVIPHTVTMLLSLSMPSSHLDWSLRPKTSPVMITTATIFAPNVCHSTRRIHSFKRGGVSFSCACLLQRNSKNFVQSETAKKPLLLEEHSTFKKLETSRLLLF